MTTTNDLIQAIASGDAMKTEDAFNAAMAEKIAVRLDDMRTSIASTMFNTPAQDPAPAGESTGE